MAFEVSIDVLAAFLPPQCAEVVVRDASLLEN